jgi:hypothetical protein
MNNLQEARAAWQTDMPRFAELGVSFEPGALSPHAVYRLEAWKRDYRLAQDALPAIQLEQNSAVPFMLTTMIDPAVFKILFAPNKAAMILGEVRKGNWLDETAMFPVIEHVGEVSSYGDYAESGHTGVNTNWPQRQSYLFQTVKEYGQRELERAGLGRINWVSQIDTAAATVLDKFQNLTYFMGVAGLQNYGLLNDPNLPAPVAPSSKVGPPAQPGWFTATGAPLAKALEVYNDILTIFTNLVVQSAGLVDRESRLVLAMSPQSQVALGFVNDFGLVVSRMLKDEFPNLRIETAVQYGVQSASNPQGNAGGNLIQMICENIEGQDTGYCSFNEKMRAFPIIQAMSSFKQKICAGTWGAVIRMPVAFSQMLGV